MNTQKLLLAGLICAAPALLRAGELNVGINLGVPVREEVVIRDTPPPPVAEQLVPAPGPNFVWIAGHWAWRGRWVWAPGHWEGMRPGAAWMAGHWERHHGGYVWVEGYWAAQPVAVAPAPVAGEVIIQQAPPPLVVERAGPPPGPEFFWIEGRWAWHGRWVWAPGHYERHPHWHPGGGWIAGHWDTRHGGYVWVEGRWR